MTTVVIMAGGRGLRLRSLTDHEPKPMLLVGGKPMLQSIIERFARHGFKKFVLCVHYKADLIEEHFGAGEELGVEITYTHEMDPLGTAGALRLLRPTGGPIIVSNADIYHDMDYRDLMYFHRGHDGPATICLAQHQYQVPYGVVEVAEDGSLATREKPIESWLVNAGVYVLDRSVIDAVPVEGPCDMPDLLAKANGTVRAYLHTGFWDDLGSFEHLNRVRGEVG